MVTRGDLLRLRSTAAYIRLHGDESWEVDALHPAVLTKIIRENVEALLDRDAMDAVVAREQIDVRHLRKAVAKE